MSFVTICAFSSESIRRSRSEYLENMFVELRNSACKRSDCQTPRIKFVFEHGCELFDIFKQFSNINSMNFEVVDEIAIGDHDYAIVPARSLELRLAKKKRVPHFIL